MGRSLLFTFLMVGVSTRVAAGDDASKPKRDVPLSRIVAGQVLASNGQPAKGALVVWSLGSNSKGTDQQCVDGKADENGDFRLESPAGYFNSTPSLPDDRLWIHHPGHDVLTTSATDAEIAPGEKPFWKGALRANCGDVLKLRIFDPADHAVPEETVQPATILIEGTKEPMSAWVPQ